MISKMLSLRVGSLTYWLRKSKPARSINGPAIGQLVVEHDQSMLGKLKLPSIMILGKGEDKDIIEDLVFRIMSLNSMV